MVNITTSWQFAILTTACFIKGSPQSKYAKLLLACPEQVREMVQVERTALETLKAEEETESLESSFVLAALNSVDVCTLNIV
jgi:hypothetical protein